MLHVSAFLGPKAAPLIATGMAVLGFFSSAAWANPDGAGKPHKAQLRQELRSVARQSAPAAPGERHLTPAERADLRKQLAKR